VAVLLHPVQRGELGSVELVAEPDRLVQLAAAVDEADQALPDLTILTIGHRPEMDLDRPVPDPRPAEEGMLYKRGSIYYYTVIFLN
jgi:hypothetical protein